jgi:hypothetical protein
MGLIDDARKRRDSWISRFDEQRQEEEYVTDTRDPEIVDKEILENCKRVGVFQKPGEGK